MGVITEEFEDAFLNNIKPESNTTTAEKKLTIWEVNRKRFETEPESKPERILTPGAKRRLRRERLAGAPVKANAYTPPQTTKSQKRKMRALNKKNKVEGILEHSSDDMLPEAHLNLEKGKKPKSKKRKAESDQRVLHGENFIQTENERSTEDIGTTEITSDTSPAPKIGTRSQESIEEYEPEKKKKKLKSTSQSQNGSNNSNKVAVKNSTECELAHRLNEQVTQEKVRPEKKKRKNKSALPSETTAEPETCEEGTTKQADPKNQPKKTRYVLFVGNLPYSITTEQVAHHFSKEGIPPISVRLPLTQTNEFRGFGYVEFNSKEGLKKALKLHHSKLGKRQINVLHSNKKIDKNSTKQKVKNIPQQCQSLSENIDENILQANGDMVKTTASKVAVGTLNSSPEVGSVMSHEWSNLEEVGTATKKKSFMDKHTAMKKTKGNAQTDSRPKSKSWGPALDYIPI